MESLIDVSDRHLVEGLRWHFMGGYAMRDVTIQGKTLWVRLHRLVLGLEDIECRVRTPGTLVDHINHDTLDNRRSNLRPCSHSENMRNRRVNKTNRCGYKGVTITRHGNYLARISDGDRRLCLGTYKTAEEAARVYNEAAIRLYGEFALVNIIPSPNPTQE
jgi:hypothetical protein